MLLDEHVLISNSIIISLLKLYIDAWKSQVGKHSLPPDCYFLAPIQGEGHNYVTQFGPRNI